MSYRVRYVSGTGRISEAAFQRFRENCAKISGHEISGHEADEGHRLNFSGLEAREFREGLSTGLGWGGLLQA
jgi:hypothetical protein